MRNRDNQDWENLVVLMIYLLAVWAIFAFTPGCTTLPPSTTKEQGSAPVVIAPAEPAPTTKPFPINRTGLDLVEYYEGLYLKAYKDSVGVWTICYGRINYPDGHVVKAGDTATKKDCEEWLLADLEEEGARFVRALAAPKYGAFTENEFSALISMTYNRGPTRLKLLLAESKDKKELADNLLHYDYAGSTNNHLLGLKRRRRSERALFLNQDWNAYKGWTQ